MAIQVSVSNQLDAPDVKVLKTALKEYSDIIVDSPIFNTNNNKEDIKSLLYTFLEDLYIKEPEEVINFVNQKPSKKLINGLFDQFGISRRLSKAFPDMLKTKTAYLLSQLFESKGSNVSFELFNDIISEFYHNLNFYNVRIEQRQFKSKYESPTTEYIYYLSLDGTPSNKYAIDAIPSKIKDVDIGYKVFPKVFELENRVEFFIKLFEPAAHNIIMKLDYTDKFSIKKGSTEILINMKKYDILSTNVDRKLTSAEIKEYLDDSKIVIDEMYYVDSDKLPLASYNKTSAQFVNFKDTVFVDTSTGVPKKTFRLTPKYDGINDIIKYTLNFPFTVTDNIHLKLNNIVYDIPKEINGSATTKFDLEIRNYNLSVRSENELRYMLEPVLIKDPLSVLTEIDANDLRTSKYLMRRFDYFDTDTRNRAPKNVFPISTNVLYIQFGTSETMDHMEFLPDLVRMFSMTKTQNDVFTFRIGGSVIKLTMSDYMNMLMFIKLKEIEVKTPGWTYKGTNTLNYNSLLFPIENLDEIYKLILYYKDMKHVHKDFLEFKRRLNKLLGSSNQLQETKIFNIAQFHEYLAGNIPKSFDEFFIKLDEFYPDGTNIISGKDQHKLMKIKINSLYKSYKPSSPRELFNIIALSDKEYIELNNGLYDMLKLHFIDRYPRVVEKIEAITKASDFVELFLLNYKQMLVEVVKMDNFITYFVNDTFKRFLLASTFKEEFFNPVVDLFQQYFFKAELSYQNTDATIQIIRDKMQQVTVGDDASFEVDIIDIFSEITPIDNQYLITNNIVKDSTKAKDKFNIQIINDSTVTSFTESTDAYYGTKP